MSTRTKDHEDPTTKFRTLFPTPVVITHENYDAIRKELWDKLAWAVGSTFKLRYGRRSQTFVWAARLSDKITSQRMQIQEGLPER